jgi:CubicO group peptidase (beta-lactamase class C family)
MRLFFIALLLAAIAPSLLDAQLTADQRAKVAQVAEKVLAETGVPSASVGIVVDGKVAYAKAFGFADKAAGVKATAEMAYPIGSISKQFTATAALLLQQEGKLNLDDKVGKYFPELTRANEVTLRNLMTMTSGYEDFAPQDYIIPAWRKPVDPLTNVREWAKKPLDFEPGTDWQYSNTNYVLLGLIVQKVSGEPLYKFIRERVLGPLKLDGVFNTYTQRERLQVTGYVSNAMAPVRVLPLEGTGWYFGDGDLAMPAATLLQWDLGIMNQSLLTPASYKEFETPFVLKSGRDSGYGLGIFVGKHGGHRMFEHDGEVGGYVSENMVFPDDNVAIVVLTNEVASEAASEIAGSVAGIVLPESKPATTPASDVVAAFAPKLKTIIAGLQKSEIDRSLFTADCNDYFGADALADFHSTLGALGEVTTVTPARNSLRGGMTFGLYRVAFSGGTTVLVTVYLQPDGAQPGGYKVEQLLVVGKG